MYVLLPMVMLWVRRLKDNPKGLTPANGISPNFIHASKVFYHNALVFAGALFIVAYPKEREFSSYVFIRVKLYRVIE